MTVGIPLTGHVNQERLSRFYVSGSEVDGSLREREVRAGALVDRRPTGQERPGTHLAHTRGVTPSPGLYMLGLTWQHTRGSALLGWVGNDAAFLAVQIACANR